jgi:phosphopantetheinyl transferase
VQVVVDFHFKVTHSEVVAAVVLQQQVVAVDLQQVVLVVLVEHLQLTQHPQLEVVVEVEQEDNH